MTDAAQGITAALAEYGRSTEFEKLPKRVVERTKALILDQLGCIVLGCTLPVGRLIAQYVSNLGSRGSATVVGSSFTASQSMAALANGTAGHADELDAVFEPSGHAAASGIAAALAVCEARGLGGPDLINAVVLHHDVTHRMTKAIGTRGLSVEYRIQNDLVSSLGTAAAASRLLSLGQMQFQYALGLSPLQVFGPLAMLGEQRRGSKALYWGQLAYAGVTSAELASLGFEANERMVEAPGGLLDVWRTEGTNHDAVTAGLGTDFAILRTWHKYYAAGAPIHAPLAAAFDVMSVSNIKVDDIVRLTVGMTTSAAAVVDSRSMPSICLQDMLSVGLHMGRLGFEEAHNAELLKRRDVSRLRDAIKVVRDDALDKKNPLGRSAWVEIETAGGGIYRSREREAPGHWSVGGMPWPDIVEKFSCLVAPRLGSTVAEATISFVAALEDQPTLDELSGLLRGGPADSNGRTKLTDGDRRGAW